MNKSELIKLFETQPLQSMRTMLRPMTDSDLKDFLSHSCCSFAVAETELEEVFKAKCKELLSSENEIIFTIRLKECDLYIGYFELKKLNTEPEIGIDLIEDYQQQGFGFEVCSAVIDYVFGNTDIDVIKYNCFRNNAAGLKLAEKLGAVRVNEKALFEKLQEVGLPQETIDKAVGFDVIVHEIRKNAEICQTKDICF